MGVVEDECDHFRLVIAIGAVGSAKPEEGGVSRIRSWNDWTKVVERGILRDGIESPGLTAVSGIAAKDFVMPLSVSRTHERQAVDGIDVRREIDGIEVTRIQADVAGVIVFTNVEPPSGEADFVVVPTVSVPPGIAVAMVLAGALVARFEAGRIFLNGIDDVRVTIGR